MMQEIADRSPHDAMDIDLKSETTTTSVMSEVDERYSLQVVLQKAITLFGLKERAFQWMTESNTHLKDCSPLELMSTNAGAQTVFALLESLQSTYAKGSNLTKNATDTDGKIPFRPATDPVLCDQESTSP